MRESAVSVRRAESLTADDPGDFATASTSVAPVNAFVSGGNAGRTGWGGDLCHGRNGTSAETSDWCTSPSFRRWERPLSG